MQLKERLILLEAENANTQRLYDALKSSEEENQQLMLSNKALYSQLCSLQGKTAPAQANEVTAKGKAQTREVFSKSMVNNNHPMSAS